MFARLGQFDPDRVHLLEVVGRLDRDTVPVLADGVASALAGGRNQLILDLSGVQYINSAGLRELVQILKRVQRADGSLMLVNPSERVRRLLEIVGLDSVFEIYTDSRWNPLYLPTTPLRGVPRQMCYCA